MANLRLNMVKFRKVCGANFQKRFMDKFPARAGCIVYNILLLDGGGYIYLRDLTK